MRKLKDSAIVAAATLLTSPLGLFAADTNITIKTDESYDLGEVVGKFLNWAILLGGLAVLIYLIMAGIKYITSSGDPGKVEEAQKQIVSAIIGLAIIVLAFTIVNLVMTMLGQTGGLGNLNFGSITKGK